MDNIDRVCLTNKGLTREHIPGHQLLSFISKNGDEENDLPSFDTFLTELVPLKQLLSVSGGVGEWVRVCMCVCDCSFQFVPCFVIYIFG